MLLDWINKNESIDFNDLEVVTKNLIKAVMHESSLKNEAITNLNPQYINVNEQDLEISIIENHNYSYNTYTAPEYFTQLDVLQENYKVDVYSIGAIFYEIVFGTSIWDEENITEGNFVEYLSDKLYTIDLEDDEIQPFAPFFKATLAVNPDNRLDLQALLDLCPWDAEDVTEEEVKEEPIETEQLKYASEMKQPLEMDNLDDLEEAELEIIEGREIGIDLGTTNSVISYVENGKIHTLEFRNGVTEPSVIFFDTPTKKFFGKKAYDKGIDNPQSCVRLFKRKLKNKKDLFQIEFYKNEEQTVVPESKTYIFDTNTFIHEPFILSEVNQHNRIALSKTVIEELTYIRDNNPNISLQAEKAISEIQKFVQNNRAQLVDSDNSLLPEDLFSNASTNNDINDNKILSIALKLIDESPVLVTSDKALQLKAEKALTTQIPYESLTDFKLDQPIKSARPTDTLRLTGEEATALFLRHLRETASKEIGYVSRAVITVPANFSNVEIEATKNAGFEAGFTDIQIQKEPVAAAFAYGVEEKVAQKLLVYDFGGGTFDVSIIDIDGKGKMEVLATGGDASLGGEDVTELLVEWIYEKLEDEHDLIMFDLEESELTGAEFKTNQKEIYKQAEKVKKELSEATVADVQLLNIYKKTNEMTSIEIEITRAEFNRVIRDVVAKASRAMNNAIVNAKLLIEDIDTIILAGGTSSIPAIQESVEKQFGKKPYYTKNTATVISQGAALFASSAWGAENQERIVDEPIVIDNALTSFGVALKNYRYDELIPVHSELPVVATKEYRLTKDYQENLRIDVYTREAGMEQAVRTVDEGIEFLDNIYIQGLPPLKQNDAVISVKFDISKEYILHVTAKVLDNSGKEITSKWLEVSKESRMK